MYDGRVIFERSTMTCPICKRVVTPSEPRSPTAPFCSERCRVIDLGSWLQESYRVTAAVADEDLDASPLLDGDPAN